ncbi:MAG: MarR family transcriptional regulator [Sandaracinus sp.]
MKRRQARPATALRAPAPKAPSARAIAPLGIDADEAARLGRTRTAQLRLVRAVLVLAGHLRTRIDAQLAADGLTTQQAAVMTIVRSAGRPSFREVAEALGTSPQNVRQLVEVLVRKGFARVVDDTEDRRVKRLVATAKNARYWAARDDGDHEALLALFDDLSTAETERALEVLVRVLDRARARPDAPPPRRGPAVRRASRGSSR